MEDQPMNLGQFPKLTTKGDIAAAGLGFALGFAVDIFLFPAGVPPGTTASVFMAGAVGLKNSAQAALESRSTKKAEQNKRGELRQKAEALLRALQRAHLTQERELLEQDMEFWEQEIYGDDDLKNRLPAYIERIRTSKLLVGGLRSQTGSVQIPGG